MHRSPIRLALLATALAVTLGGCAPSPLGRTDPPEPRKTVTFHDVSFEIPERGWRDISDKARRAQFLHTYGEQRSIDIAIWPIRVPPELSSLGPRDHASKYFDAERNLPRYQGRWEGFAESEREIGSRRYHVMTFRISRAVGEPVVDGLFLLYFPDDLGARQRFYVLMWSDTHPAGEPGRGLEDLDAIVSSLRCCQ